MGQIYQFPRTERRARHPEVDDFAAKAAAYRSDVTYGTNTEMGFDYLRDNMAGRREHMVQRGHVYGIVDEVDSILIDEARTPLIISGPSNDSTKLYYQFASVVRTLRRDVDYEVDEEKRTAVPTEAGIAKVERQLGVENLYDSVAVNYVHQLEKALQAKELYHRDKDYLVTDGEVKIVDEFTGRIMEGRRWSDGLHQAVEAKERVKIQDENHTWATITLQNYFRMYEKLAGMTGTAETEAAEFASTYQLHVVPIPTHRPMIRTDEPDLIFKTEAVKFEAVVEDLKERYESGQPVLVGTASVAKSEELSLLLDKQGIPHHVLNAKHHAQEAVIVAQAGRLHAITVATNMAGRGVDIVLGGNPEGLAHDEVRAQGLEVRLRRGPRALRVAAGEVQAAVRRRGGRGARPRRAVRARQRAPREPPHRQPAPGPVRAPGRPGREPLLPVAQRTSSCACSPPGPSAGSWSVPCPRTCRSRPAWSQRPSSGPSTPSRGATPRPARSCSSTTRCATSSAR